MRCVYSATHHLLGAVTGSVSWFNRRHRRSGHLFLGSFKAVLVDWESWWEKSELQAIKELRFRA